MKGALLRAKKARKKRLKAQLLMQSFNQTAFKDAITSCGTSPDKFKNHGKYYLSKGEQNHE